MPFSTITKRRLFDALWDRARKGQKAPSLRLIAKEAKLADESAAEALLLGPLQPEQAATDIHNDDPPARLADLFRSWIESPAFEESLKAERALVELMEEIRDTPDEQRHDALVWWARSPFWHAALMLAQGWHGQLARDAWKALKHDLDADTPSRRWNNLDPAVGRASINRLLGMEGEDGAFYATAPFRTWVDDDERPWIAGAIGICPAADHEAVMRWAHIDIRAVILWDPRTNEVGLAGEHPSVSLFLMPEYPDRRLTVWADGAAFFRAWAAARRGNLNLLRAAARGEWRHPASELAESGLPGALLIGSVSRARWPMCEVETVISGPGLTAAELHAAAIRGANLPSFEGGMRGRGA